MGEAQTAQAHLARRLSNLYNSRSRNPRAYAVLDVFTALLMLGLGAFIPPDQGHLP